MMPGEYEPALLSEGVAKSHLELMAVGNGYFVTFQKGRGQRPPAEEVEAVSDVSEDERIDAMVDAIAAFIGFINDKGAGEDWKSEENREKIRAGFKAMVPSSAFRQHRAYAPPPQPEQLVFKTKAELVKFIEENF